MSDSGKVVQFPGTLGGDDGLPDPTEEELAESARQELACFLAAPEELQMLTRRMGRWVRLVELDAPAVIVQNEMQLVRKAIPMAMAYIVGLVAHEFGIKDIRTGEMIGDNE